MKLYKVFFHAGEELGLKTHVFKGTASLDSAGLHVRGATAIDVRIEAITNVKMFRLHGLGRVIQIDSLNGRLFISVIRLMIGQFAFINFFKTGELFNQLSSIAKSR